MLVLVSSIVGIVVARWQIALKKQDAMDKTRYKVTLVCDDEEIVYDNLELDSYIYLPMKSKEGQYFEGWKLGDTILKATNNDIAYEVLVSTIKGSSNNTEFTLNASFTNVPDGFVLFKIQYNSEIIKQVLVSKTETKFYLFNINIPEKQNNKFLSHFTTSESFNHYNYFGESTIDTTLSLNDYFDSTNLSNLTTVTLDAVYE